MPDPSDGPSTAGKSPEQSRSTSWPTAIVAALNRLLRGKDDSAKLRESLEEVIEQSDAEDRPLAREERSMMLNILQFGELTVADIMVPRADIIGVEASMSLDALARIFSDAQHSRLPVYRESLDHPVGMVHIKDLIGLAVPEGEGVVHPKTIQDIRRDVLFVPPSMPVVNLMVKMQSSRVHLALVIDEYGGTDGLVSIEDIVEQIVGDIEDEHDTDDVQTVTPRGPGEFDASARTDLEEVEKLVGFRLADEDTAEEIDTLAGLVFSLVSRVPQRGEIVKHPAGVEFEVLEADPRRLRRLRVRVTRPNEPAPAVDRSAAHARVPAEADG